MHAFMFLWQTSLSVEMSPVPLLETTTTMHALAIPFATKLYLKDFPAVLHNASMYGKDFFPYTMAIAYVNQPLCSSLPLAKIVYAGCMILNTLPMFHIPLQTFPLVPS